MIERAKDVILDALFPRFCLSCQKEGRYLCLKCSLLMQEVPLVCPYCLFNEKNGKTHQECYRDDYMSGLVSFWEYEGLAKKAIYQTKKESLIDIPREMTEVSFLLMDRDQGRFSSFLNFLYNSDVVITCVPMTKERQKERGFNQSEVVGKRMSRLIGISFSDLLIKKRDNQPQKDLDKKERFLNVRGVFVFNEKITPPERVIVVDDVWTSGATMREAVKIIKRAGVKEVWGVTLTRVS